MNWTSHELKFEEFSSHILGYQNAKWITQLTWFSHKYIVLLLEITWYVFVSLKFKVCALVAQKIVHTWRQKFENSIYWLKWRRLAFDLKTLSLRYRSANHFNMRVFPHKLIIYLNSNFASLVFQTKLNFKYQTGFHIVLRQLSLC